MTGPTGRKAGLPEPEPLADWLPSRCPWCWCELDWRLLAFISTHAPPPNETYHRLTRSSVTDGGVLIVPCWNSRGHIAHHKSGPFSQQEGLLIKHDAGGNHHARLTPLQTQRQPLSSHRWWIRARRPLSRWIVGLETAPWDYCHSVLDLRWIHLVD